MGFSVSDKMQTIIGMIDELVEKELVPLKPGFLARRILSDYAGKRIR